MENMINVLKGEGCLIKKEFDTKCHTVTWQNVKKTLNSTSKFVLVNESKVIISKESFTSMSL